MSIYGVCGVCKGETKDYLCSNCLHDRVVKLEDALQEISRVCLHKQDAVIWEIIKNTIGEHGEKRVT